MPVLANEGSRSPDAAIRHSVALSRVKSTTAANDRSLIFSCFEPLGFSALGKARSWLSGYVKLIYGCHQDSDERSPNTTNVRNERTERNDSDFIFMLYLAKGRCSSVGPVI